MENEEVKIKDTIIEDDGITFLEIWQHIKEHIIAIIVILIVFTSGGFIFNEVKEPEYKSKATFLISYESGSDNLNSDLQFSSRIVNTFVEFIKKDIILKPVAQEFDLNIKELKNNLHVTANGDSLIIDISFDSNDRKLSKDVLTRIMDLTIEVTNKLNDNNKPEYKMLYDNIKILSPADDAIELSNTLKYVIVFILFGLIVAGVYVLVCVYNDKRFKSTDQIERVLGLPVLACIPEYAIDEDKKGKI